MSRTDSRGIAHSTTSHTALERYETALTLFHGYFEDPLAVIDEALREAPEFVSGHCLRAALMLTSSDRACESELRQSVNAAEALTDRANERERRHIAAARAWLDGDFARSVDLYGEIVVDHPRDALAIQVAHLGDFYLGRSAMLRDRIAQVLPHWDASVPGFGYLLGMHAFGLEETNLFDRAEEAGRRALELERRDPWAVHAVAHVMEMQGRLEEGVAWLTSREADWAPDNFFAAHNWWHLALYHLDLGHTERALELYDHGIWSGSTVILDLIDASAMLWRMRLRGVDVGDRWRRLADTWEAHVDDGYYAFNDAHAMMALVADGRDLAARRLLATLAERADDHDTNAIMTRDVGLAVCRAIHAFEAGDHDAVIEQLMDVRLIADRFGGSNAQRDFIGVTLVESALRSNRTRLAAALAAERLVMKPTSPFNRDLAARAGVPGPSGPGLTARPAAPPGHPLPQVTGTNADSPHAGTASARRVLR